MHRGRRDRDLVKALQVVGDHARPEVIVLPQVQDLADDLARRGARRPVRRPRPIAQARRADGRRTAASTCRRSAGRCRNADTCAPHCGRTPLACCNTLNRQVHNRVCSAFVIASPSRPRSTHEDAVDPAVPVDAQNAPTRTWKLQNSFHSANSAHPLFEKTSTQTEESPECQPCPGISHNELQTPALSSDLHVALFRSDFMRVFRRRSKAPGCSPTAIQIFCCFPGNLFALNMIT